jgi:hypothetical protein
VSSSSPSCAAGSPSACYLSRPGQFSSSRKFVISPIRSAAAAALGRPHGTMARWDAGLSCTDPPTDEERRGCYGAWPGKHGSRAGPKWVRHLRTRSRRPTRRHGRPPAAAWIRKRRVDEHRGRHGGTAPRIPARSREAGAVRAESCALEFESPRQLQCDGILRLRLDSLLWLMHLQRSRFGG